MRPSLFHTLLAALVLAAFVHPQAEAGPPVGSNRTAQDASFRAEWSVSGSSDAIRFGPERRTSVFRHTGTVTVVSSDGVVTSALSKCIGMSDSSTGASSRCVWVDSEGDEIFSELHGPWMSGKQTGQRRGSFVGGTGKFAGLQGDYELHWILRPVERPEDIAGQTLQMSGNWRLP